MGTFGAEGWGVGSCWAKEVNPGPQKKFIKMWNVCGVVAWLGGWHIDKMIKGIV